MFLNRKNPEVPSADRTSLQEVATLHSTPGQKLLAYGLITGSTAMILVGGYYYAIKDQLSSPTPNPAPPTNQKTAHIDVPLNFSPKRPVAAPLPPGMAPIQPEQQQQQQQQAPASNPGPTAQDLLLAEALKRKLGGGFGSEDQGKGAPDMADTALAGKGVIDPSMPPQPDGKTGRTEMADKLVGTSMPMTYASYLPDQHMILSKGTSIGCNLDTAVMTDQIGFTRCVTEYPVKSMDGKVVLMDRGTVINGEYQRGLDRGQKSIFIVWSDALTPEGVTVPLNSPGTDALGRAGLQGQIDNKFWARYGGALLFSVLQDGVAIATSQGGNGGNTQINLGNTQSTSMSAAAMILEQNKEVRPSLYAWQGARVGITVAQHVNFTKVYSLIMRARAEK